jgi:hypothetical protein
MSHHTDLAARAEAHLAAAEAAAEGDPHAAAQCALAAAILARRPRALRGGVELDLEQYLADTAESADPAVLAGRAVAAALQANAADLDDISVDDCGFPSPLPALAA